MGLPCGHECHFSDQVLTGPWHFWNRVAFSLDALLPLQAPIVRNLEITTPVACLWHTQLLARFLSRFTRLRAEVLLPFDSKLLISFSWQLTSVTGFDSVEAQFVLHPR